MNVLVVEDDPTIAEPLADGLRRRSCDMTGCGIDGLPATGHSMLRAASPGAVRVHVTGWPRAAERWV